MNNEHKHRHGEHCGCGEHESCAHQDASHEEEWEDLDDEDEILVLTLDDDTELECRVVDVFPVGEVDYIALEAMEEEPNILLYRLEGDVTQDEIQLTSIDSDDEFQKVSEEFNLRMEAYGDDEEWDEAVEDDLEDGEESESDE